MPSTVEIDFDSLILLTRPVSLLKSNIYVYVCVCIYIYVILCVCVCVCVEKMYILNMVMYYSEDLSSLLRLHLIHYNISNFICGY